MKLRALVFVLLPLLAACSNVRNIAPTPAQAESKETMVKLLDARCMEPDIIEDRRGEPCLILAYQDRTTGDFLYRMLMSPTTSMGKPRISPVMAIAPPKKPDEQLYHADFPLAGPGDGLTGPLYKFDKVYTYLRETDAGIRYRLELVMIRGCRKEDILRSKAGIDPNRLNDAFQSDFCRDDLHNRF